MSSSELIPEPTSDAPEVGFRLHGGNHDLVPKALIDQLARSKRIITYFTILSIAGICPGWLSLWRDTEQAGYRLLLVANSFSNTGQTRLRQKFVETILACLHSAG